MNLYRALNLLSEHSGLCITCNKIHRLILLDSHLVLYVLFCSTTFLPVCNLYHTYHHQLLRQRFITSRNRLWHAITLRLIPSIGHPFPSSTAGSVAIPTLLILLPTATGSHYDDYAHGVVYMSKGKVAICLRRPLYAAGLPHCAGSNLSEL